MQAAQIPVSDSLLRAAHPPCTVGVTRKLAAMFERVWAGPSSSSNLRACHRSSDTTPVIQAFVSRARVEDGERLAHFEQ